MPQVTHHPVFFSAYVDSGPSRDLVWKTTMIGVGYLYSAQDNKLEIYSGTSGREETLASITGNQVTVYDQRLEKPLTELAKKFEGRHPEITVQIDCQYPATPS
ncbi:MAG: hypothetical protein HYV90_06050 [Candidatus Woesebacteria bacterium]|nr:MAG: hypothetical protein HYV90_06050 [Candidatus Woesebacteria bacterium]